MLPLQLLFAFNHLHTWFPVTHRCPARLAERFIHSPRRILQEIGGLHLVPNSTTPPVRTSPSSVLMGFDVVTHEGNLWNARILSNDKKECDLFLMDSHTLQPIVMAKLRVPAPFSPPLLSHMDQTTISLNVIVFNTAMFLKLVATSYWNKIVRVKCSKVHHIRLGEDASRHKRYMRMVFDGGYLPYDTPGINARRSCKIR